MLKRKIEDSLTLWKDSTGHKPLVIMGINSFVFYAPKHPFWRIFAKHFLTVNLHFLRQLFADCSCSITSKC